MPELKNPAKTWSRRVAKALKDQDAAALDRCQRERHLAAEWLRPGGVLGMALRHVDAWGVERALGMGIPLQAECVFAFMFAEPSASNPRCQGRLLIARHVERVARVWEQIIPILRDQPALCDETYRYSLEVSVAYPGHACSPVWFAQAGCDIAQEVPLGGLNSHGPLVHGSPLNKAWLAGDLGRIQALLDLGADPCRSDSNGWALAGALGVSESSPESPSAFLEDPGWATVIAAVREARLKQALPAAAVPPARMRL